MHVPKFTLYFVNNEKLDAILYTVIMSVLISGSNKFKKMGSIFFNIKEEVYMDKF